MHPTLAAVVDAVAAAATRRGQAWAAGAPADLLRMLADEHAGPGGGEPREDLRRAAAVFRLSEYERDLLLIAAAADADPNLGAAYGLLDGTVGAGWPTVALAIELAGRGLADPQARAAFAAGAPLRRCGLIELTGDGPLLRRAVRLPERVAAALAGDPRPAPLTAAVLADAVPVPGPEAEALAAALAAGTSLCYLEDSPGAASLAFAAAAFELADLAHVAADLRRRAADVDVAEVVREVLRDAGLAATGVVFVGFEGAIERDPALLALLAEHPVPVVAVSRLAWDPTWLRPPPYVAVAGRLAHGQRELLWKSATGGAVDPDEPGWADLLSLRLAPEDIVQAATVALREAQGRGRPLSVADLRQAARLHGVAPTTLASLGRAHATFDDLVLPRETTQMLQQILTWARYREQVLDQGPLAGKGEKGRGITALFTGSPGTGKTLAAQAIAAELGLDIYTVRLPAVVDKYIGETEKNLDRVFGHAEQLNCVLFFDEADSLFGTRSEVRDARDRYANQEVSFLLQRMEHFDGITVLATNLSGNLDAAFARRMHFIIHFADPDVPTRRALWRAHLDAVADHDPADPADLDALSAYQLTGGEIRNIVLAAAYSAAADGGPLGLRHVLAAVEREHRKLGRFVPASAVR